MKNFPSIPWDATPTTSTLVSAIFITMLFCTLTIGIHRLLKCLLALQRSDEVAVLAKAFAALSKHVFVYRRPRGKALANLADAFTISVMNWLFSLTLVVHGVVIALLCMLYILAREFEVQHLGAMAYSFCLIAMGGKFLIISSKARSDANHLWRLHAARPITRAVTCIASMLPLIALPVFSIWFLEN